ncbi:hypothetical protein LSAT2_010839 [Lamellibrachia satsuma]|nr:hypothetical protein LSAT2_010839 [Lamellibrachia satsuma]
MKESGRQTTGNIRKTGTRYDDNCTTRVCLEKEVIHFETTTTSCKADVRRLFRLSVDEWPFLLLGLLATAAAGCTQVSFSVIFSEIIGV